MARLRFLLGVVEALMSGVGVPAFEPGLMGRVNVAAVLGDEGGAGMVLPLAMLAMIRSRTLS